MPGRRRFSLAVLLAASLSGCGRETIDLRSGATSGDAATGPDACSNCSVAPTDAGAVVPPDFCVAPCVWRALAACRPPAPGACNEDVVSTETTVWCDPRSTWFRSQSVYVDSARGVEVRYGHGGQTCFTVGSGGRGGVGGLRGISDGVRAVAAYFDPPTMIHCLDDQIDYRLEPTRPECAPWVEPDGRPIVAPRFRCESTTPGRCPPP